MTEAQAASVIANEPMFFVGYDAPDWDYFHAPRGERGDRDPTSIQERPNG